MKKYRVASFEFRVASWNQVTQTWRGLKVLTRNTKHETRNCFSSTRNSKPGILALAALLIAWPLGSGAQVLNDPTRPPPVFSNPSGDTGAAAGPLLQSVMISPAGSSAIIGGEIVKLGGKYGDARVVKITANEVVLRSANGTEILRMYPEVNMKAVRHAPAAGK
jgi:MSHA biogenesis protein MshK